MPGDFLNVAAAVDMSFVCCYLLCSAPSLLQGLPRQNENPVQPKQRISPYLTKSQHVRTDIEIQPQSTSTVQVQAPAYEVIAILNNHIQRPEQVCE